MDLLIAFALFIACVLAMIITGHSIIIGLVIGLILLICLGLRRGYELKRVIRLALEGMKESAIVIQVLALVGILVGVWRMCGSIAMFVYGGVSFVPPTLFLISAYFVTALLSYCIGSSFAVGGTLGVVLMTIARSGGVNPLITAGVLLSGIYFGDRCSPVSSSASLVSGVTHTNLLSNVRRMMVTGMVPLIITCIVYTMLSVKNPLSKLDTGFIQTLDESFNLSIWTLLPAAIIVILPLARVNIRIAMTLSIISGGFVAYFVQGIKLHHIIYYAIFGYVSDEPSLNGLFDGGGLIAMAHIMAVVLISCACAGIFNGTDMSDTLNEKLVGWCGKYGKFPSLLVVGIASIMLFCNQAIAIIVSAKLFSKPYLENNGTNEELAIDIENSVVLIAAMIPWSIACSVPLAFFGVDAKALPFAVYMYAVPICNGLRKMIAKRGSV